MNTALSVRQRVAFVWRGWRGERHASLTLFSHSQWLQCLWWAWHNASPATLSRPEMIPALCLQGSQGCRCTLASGRGLWKYLLEWENACEGCQASCWMLQNNRSTWQRYAADDTHTHTPFDLSPLPRVGLCFVPCRHELLCSCWQPNLELDTFCIITLVWIFS